MVKVGYSVEVSYKYNKKIILEVVDKRVDQLGVEPDPDEDEIEDVVLDDDIERHWRMVFYDNNRGLDGTKSLLHAKNWDVYNLKKGVLVKCGCLVEVADKERKKITLEFVDYHVVEEGVEHKELGIQGLILIYLNKIGRDVLGRY